MQFFVGSPLNNRWFIILPGCCIIIKFPVALMKHTLVNDIPSFRTRNLANCVNQFDYCWPSGSQYLHHSVWNCWQVCHIDIKFPMSRKFLVKTAVFQIIIKPRHLDFIESNCSRSTLLWGYEQIIYLLYKIFSNSLWWPFLFLFLKYDTPLISA